MSEADWLTPEQMAGLEGITLSTLCRRAVSRDWRVPEQQHPANPKGWWRRKDGKGGGYQYHYTLLSIEAQTKFLTQRAKQPAPAPTPKATKQQLAQSDAWRFFNGLTEKRKKAAADKLAVLQTVEDMARAVGKHQAVTVIGAEKGLPPSTIYGWYDRVAGVERSDWLAYLVDHYCGRTATAEVHPDAWEYFKRDYLRASQPAAAASYRRLQDQVKKQGWPASPPLKTLLRKLTREVDAKVIILEREGPEALIRKLPAQRRDRSGFHAMEALNYDGHKLDVFVEWPDGKTGRAILLAFQDLYSGAILGWRLDRSESAMAFRLAFADVVESYGLPTHVWSDNTMAAAAKENTAGASRYRYRFKTRDDDAIGVFSALQVEIHFTKPAHGQSKPIERVFRTMAEYISRAPECEGAYTGNTPVNKPHNYGARAIPLADLIAVCEREITRFNTDASLNAPSRRSGGKGRSRLEMFNESYGRVPQRTIGVIPPEKRWMLLLSAEGVTCRQPDGAVYLFENRYWHQKLIEHIGRRVVLRFDPDRLHQPVHVYRLDGSYICAAECVHDVGFADADAAKEKARLEKSVLRKTKELAKEQVALSAADVARMQVKPEAPPSVEAKVVRPVFGVGNLAPRISPEPEPDDDAFFSAFGRSVKAVAAND